MTVTVDNSNNNDFAMLQQGSSNNSINGASRGG